MKRLISILTFAVLSTSLAACGGGGGGALPATQATSAPTTQPTSTSQQTTISGNVAQMTGPLSSSTWNLAAPSGCPPASDPSASCTSYPTPPPMLPNTSASPQAGTGVAGVTVYIVAANAVDTNVIPTAPLATAVTNASGAFTATLSASTLGGATQVGLIAVNGTSIGSNGATNLGYTIAHAVVNVTAKPTLLIDTLSGDEQSAFTALNSDRAAASLAPIASDTIAQAVARLSVAQRPGTATCADQISDGNYFSTFGGLPGTETAWEDTAGTQWSVIVNYGSPWNSASHLAGLAALYSAPSCGGGFIANINYYAAEYL